MIISYFNSYSYSNVNLYIAYYLFFQSKTNSKGEHKNNRDYSHFLIGCFLFLYFSLDTHTFCISPSQLSPDPTIHIEPCLLGEMYWNRRFIMKDLSLQKESDSACWKSTRITSSVPRTITGRRSSFRTLGERQLLRIQMNSIIKWSPTTGYV